MCMMPGMLRCLACVAAMAMTTTAMAQTYPSKPLRLVLPYTPGGVVDFIGRTLALR